MEKQYAQLLSRVKAAVVDGVLLIAAMYAITEILALFEHVPQYVRIIAFVFIFFLYDPIFISLFGGTIGHSFSGIAVKREHDPEKNILFPVALLRFIFKSTLGWLSLLTVTGNAKKKAIHDYVAQSVVVMQNN